MNIVLNEQPKEIAAGTTILGLMNEGEYRRNMTAVWINGRQALTREYETYVFCEGDEVKLVRLTGGG